MSTYKGKAKFENFLILLDSGCSSKIVMRRQIETFHPKKYDVMQWHIQVGNITTNLKVRIYFNLTELSTAKIVTWNFHVGDSSRVRYDMILGIDILAVLGLILRLSENIIEAGDITLKG